VTRVDSGLRRNDKTTQPPVIPAQAGIQEVCGESIHPGLLRRYANVLKS
jgi:hypothetical protein